MPAVHCGDAPEYAWSICRLDLRETLSYIELTSTNPEVGCTKFERNVLPDYLAHKPMTKLAMTKAKVAKNSS